MKTLSIITINKNNAGGLEKTIQSVVCQTYTDLEYIVIDGASGDESVEIIKKYADKINYWVSEPDTGIYNAMNKGICEAKGEYCLFLNSGDWLISSSTLDNVFKEISGNPSDIFYSDRINTDNTIVRYPKSMTIDFLLERRINHQNSLLRRSLFLKHGLYNENLKIASDWEYFLNEYWRYKSTFYHIETNISVFDIHGIGSQKSVERFAENTMVLKNVFQELANIIIEHHNFRSTIYYGIITEIGDTKILSYLLRFYRKSYLIIGRIISIFYYQNKKEGNA